MFGISTHAQVLLLGATILGSDVFLPQKARLVGCFLSQYRSHELELIGSHNRSLCVSPSQTSDVLRGAEHWLPSSSAFAYPWGKLSIRLSITSMHATHLPFQIYSLSRPLFRKRLSSKQITPPFVIADRAYRWFVRRVWICEHLAFVQRASPPF